MYFPRFHNAISRFSHELRWNYTKAHPADARLKSKMLQDAGQGLEKEHKGKRRRETNLQAK